MSKYNSQSGLSSSPLGLLFVSILWLAFVASTQLACKPARVECEPPVAEYAPDPGRFGFEMDGFDSPYLGQTGSWDGKGGVWIGESRLENMAFEASMGLRWTFSPVYWNLFEPDGPADMDGPLPEAWDSLDQSIVDAHDLGLNVLMQMVLGGNAKGPPDWAGLRKSETSAPADMEAAAAFVGKLVERYRPGGTLAQRMGWDEYGIRAWELDNEPDSYRTNWFEVADDFAEYFVRAAARVKEVDPLALVVGPAIAAGNQGMDFTDMILSSENENSSEFYREAGQAYAIGPSVDVVSFHNYELLDRVFAGEPRTIACVLKDMQERFDSYTAQEGFSYPAKEEYWHTEGGYDYLDFSSETKRENWVIQWFCRAFAAGVRKVMVKDASPGMARSVKTMVELLPDPFPMEQVNKRIGVSLESASVYRVERRSDGGWTYVAWAENGSWLDRSIELPIRSERAFKVSRDGKRKELTVSNGHVHVTLSSGTPFAEPVFVVEE